MLARLAAASGRREPAAVAEGSIEERRRLAISIRVHAVGSKQHGAAYQRLAECDLEVASQLAHLGLLNEVLLDPSDVVLVGCSDKLLLSPAFQRRVQRLARRARILAVAAEVTPSTAAYAARLGFHGFIARDASPDAVRRSVGAVARGELAFPRATLSALVVLDHARTPERSAPVDVEALTPRQRQIVDLIARGATDREIADLLRISRSTAHKHVQNALRRANARTRSQLAAGIRGAAVEQRDRPLFGFDTSLWSLVERPALKGKGIGA